MRLWIGINFCQRRASDAWCLPLHELQAAHRQRIRHIGVLSAIHVAGSEGEMLVYAFHHAAKDHDQERHFFGKCGTTLFWYTSARPHLIGIAAGCFPDESLGEPTVSVTSCRKLAWVGLPSACKLVEMITP